MTQSEIEILKLILSNIPFDTIAEIDIPDNLNTYGTWDHELKRDEGTEEALNSLYKKWIVEIDGTDSGDNAIYLTTKGYQICKELKLIHGDTE